MEFFNYPQYIRLKYLFMSDFVGFCQGPHFRFCEVYPPTSGRCAHPPALNKEQPGVLPGADALFCILSTWSHTRHPRQDGAGDKSSLPAQQEVNGGCHLLRLALPPQRVVLVDVVDLELLGVLLRTDEAVAHRRACVSGRHRIDADAQRGTVQRAGFGELRQPALGGAVGRQVGETHDGGIGRLR